MFEIVIFFNIFFNFCLTLEVLLQLSAFSPTNLASSWGGWDPGWQGHFTDVDDILCTSVDFGHVLTPKLPVLPHVSQSTYQVRLFIKWSCHFSF